MKKKIRNQNIYFHIAWSPIYKYDKFDAIRVLPELPGILCLIQKINNRHEYLIFYSCWRDGLRIGLKKLLDPIISKFPSLAKDTDKDFIYYKYSEVSGDFIDIKDIMYNLIQKYSPAYNNKDFKDSKRFRNIYLKESERSKTDVIEKIPDLNW